jgi:esterase/lipase superfamily enzyme
MALRPLALLLCLLLAACAGEKRPAALVPVEAGMAEGKTLDMVVATTRGVDATTGFYNDKRAQDLSYQALRLSFPPTHVPGNIEWPSSFPGNPATEIVTLSNTALDSAGFLKAVESRLPPSGEVFVFVHGYNTPHEAAVFRLAQIVVDSGLKAAPIAFTWPSRGDIRDYVTDRESIMAARNRLSDMLEALARSPRVRKINLFSHSMGTMLTMETLVRLKLSGNGELGGKLDTLVLASPDIDVDVFLSQFEVIGKRPRPTVILISRDDRALNISRKIAGNVVRVGAASPTDPASVAAIRKFGFTVIDLTNVETNDRTNHTKFAASPVFLQQIGGHLGGSMTAGKNPVGSFITNTAGAILDLPSDLLHRVTD